MLFGELLVELRDDRRPPPRAQGTEAHGNAQILEEMKRASQRMEGSGQASPNRSIGTRRVPSNSGGITTGLPIRRMPLGLPSPAGVSAQRRSRWAS